MRETQLYLRIDWLSCLPFTSECLLCNHSSDPFQQSHMQSSYWSNLPELAGPAAPWFLQQKWVTLGWKSFCVCIPQPLFNTFCPTQLPVSTTPRCSRRSEIWPLDASPICTEALVCLFLWHISSHAALLVILLQLSFLLSAWSQTLSRSSGAAPRVNYMSLALSLFS